MKKLVISECSDQYIGSRFNIGLIQSHEITKISTHRVYRTPTFSNALIFYIWNLSWCNSYLDDFNKLNKSL